MIKGSRKKKYFLSGPLDLVAYRNFFSFIKEKVRFSLVAHPFSPPPPLSGPATKKRTFFAASLIKAPFFGVFPQNKNFVFSFIRKQTLKTEYYELIEYIVDHT